MYSICVCLTKHEIANFFYIFVCDYQNRIPGKHQNNDGVLQ